MLLLVIVLVVVCSRQRAVNDFRYKRIAWLAIPNEHPIMLALYNFSCV